MSRYYNDPLGIRRNSETHYACLLPTEHDPSEYIGTDALSWVECNSTLYVYSLPGHARPTIKIPPGVPRPKNMSYFITSPNATTIPNLVGLDGPGVYIRTDGRFFTADFQIFPQWYFPATYYLPFVRSKPPANVLNSHPLRLIWYDVDRNKDFMQEPGCLVEGYSRIKEDLANSFVALRKDLTAKVEKLVGDAQFPQERYREMIHCNRAMHFAALVLTFAPQSYMLTLLTITLFQRAYLETLACYEYLTIWEERKNSLSLARRPVDTSIMGAFTCSPQVAEEFNQLGVPVWYLRHVGTISRDMKVGSAVYPSVPEGAVKDIFYDSERVYIGDPSARRNRACQSLRLQTINLGHAAYELQPGDANQGYAPPPDPTVPTHQGPEPTQSSSTLTVPSSSQLAPIVPLPIVFTTANYPKLASKVAKGIDINYDKFKVPSPSAFIPYVLPHWSAALASVVTIKDRIIDHPDRILFKGYAVLDPSIVVSSNTSSDRRDRYLMSWLLIRGAWLAAVTTRSQKDRQPMPLSQNWKDFLWKISQGLGLEKPSPSSGEQTSIRHENTGSEARRPVKRRTRGGDQSKYDIAQVFNLDVRTKVVDVYWDGDVILTADSLENGKIGLQDHLVRDIVWDLYEQNFRLELLALDKCVLPRLAMSDEARSAREDMLASLFPDGLVILHRLPMQDNGLGARDMTKRKSFISAFYTFLAAWPGATNFKIFSSAQLADDNLREAEEAASRFYCQTFFDYFGRAASIPHAFQ